MSFHSAQKAATNLKPKDLERSDAPHAPGLHEGPGTSALYPYRFSHCQVGATESSRLHGHPCRFSRQPWLRNWTRKGASPLEPSRQGPAPSWVAPKRPQSTQASPSVGTPPRAPRGLGQDLTQVRKTWAALCGRRSSRPPRASICRPRQGDPNRSALARPTLIGEAAKSARSALALSGSGSGCMLLEASIIQDPGSW